MINCIHLYISNSIKLYLNSCCYLFIKKSLRVSRVRRQRGAYFTNLSVVKLVFKISFWKKQAKWQTNARRTTSSRN